MAHQLVGTFVNYLRPEDAKGKRTLVSTHAVVIGVEPQDGASPRLHLAFVHPNRVDSLTGSGWRDAFDRAISVRPQSDPLVAENPNLPYYEDASADDLKEQIRQYSEWQKKIQPAFDKQADEKGKLITENQLQASLIASLEQQLADAKSAPPASPQEETAV